MIYLLIGLIVAAGVAYYSWSRPSASGGKSGGKPGRNVRKVSPKSSEGEPASQVSSLLSRINVGHNSEMEARIQEIVHQDVPDPALLTQGQNPQDSLQNARHQYLEKPHDPQNVSFLAYHLYMLREIDEALELYEYGLKIKPEDPSMMLYQGSCYYLKKQTRMARKIWTQVVEVAAGTKLAAKAEARLKQLDKQEAADT